MARIEKEWLEDVVPRCQSADPTISTPAWTELMQQVWPVMIKLAGAQVLANSTVRYATDAEELAAQAYLRLVRHIHGFTKPGGLVAWLKVVITNLATDAVRRASHRATLPGELPDYAAPQDHAATTIEGSRSLVAFLCDTLTPDELALLYERYWNDKTPGELATAYGTGYKTMSARLSRLNAKLRHLLVAHGNRTFSGAAADFL